jgi:uncharacterized phage protein gp47/JayE
MTFGLSPAGFRIKRLPNIQQDLENALKAQFGEINVEPQSVFGQLVGVYSKVLADIWENLEDVYFSQYPNSAEGIALDNVVLLNGLTRLPASQTIVTASVFGNNGTLIPANSQIKIPDTNTIFYNPADIVISNANANFAAITATDLLAQVYTVLINGEPFRYALPLLLLTGSYVTGNVISVIVNGTTLGPIGYAGSSSSTNFALATLIATHPDVLATGAPNGSTITVTPVVGKYLTVGPVMISGGVSQPSYSINTYSAPAFLENVAENLAANINFGNQPVTAVYDGTPTFTVNADETSASFSVSLGDGLNLNNLSSPGIFLSQAFGPVAAPANSVTEIVTPVNGWFSVNNLEAGLTGRDRETDAELRLRQARSLRILGYATLESIRARILQEVPGVTAVYVFENVTMTQEPTTITLSTQLITANVVSVTIDGNALTNTVFTTDHLTTMQLVANKIMAVPGVASATVGGVNNLTLTINTVPGDEIFVDVFDVTLGASQPESTILIGRPPKSFEAIVQGGSNQTVADKIWQVKPAGIQTFGNVNDYGGVPIIDSQGTQHYIYFSRAQPVYIWVQVQLQLYSGETFPLNGIQQVKDAILAYGNSLGIGTDVLLQRVLAQIFQVPGIAGGTMTIAATADPDGNPVYGSSDIIIGDSQVSAWDLVRIIVTVA